jgi:uncharacterized protein YcbK (DUF882 family)
VVAISTEALGWRNINVGTQRVVVAIRTILPRQINMRTSPLTWATEYAGKITGSTAKSVSILGTMNVTFVCRPGRRAMNRYLKISLITVLTFAPIPALMPAENVRQLSFYHTHTAEKISVSYFANGQYDASALAELNHFLRDFRTGDETTMDPGVFDILFEIQQQSGSTGVFHVISAYRSPETNEMLRDRSGGVAKNSQHLLGRAIDVRLSDLDTAELRDVARSLELGGVGYYNDSDFVHVDTGRVRQW